MKSSDARQSLQTDQSRYSGRPTADHTGTDQYGLGSLLISVKRHSTFVQLSYRTYISVNFTLIA